MFSLHSPNNTLRVLRLFAIAVALKHLSCAGYTQAEEIVVADDGSEILLRDDGSWIQLSRDRHATSSTGARIKLSPNGSWQIIENNSHSNTEISRSIKQHHQDRGSSTERDSQINAQNNLPAKIQNSFTGNTTSPARVAKPENLVEPNAKEKPFAVLLQSAEILKVKTKTLKSSRIKTRTIYNLTVKNLGTTQLDLTSLAKENFKATLSNGRELAVIAIENDTQILKPDETAKLRIVADSSPRWFDIKYLSIALKENTITIHPQQILSINMADVTRKTVDGF